MSINCPICLSPARLMAPHPEANIYRCEQCTHAFSDAASMPEQETYDSSYYDEAHRRWFKHPNLGLFDRIASLIPQGASVLDIGCGRGDFLKHLHKKRPDLDLTGIDYSPNQDPEIHFLQGDAFTTEFLSQFDVTVSLAVIEHVEDCVAFTHRMRVLTKPGGMVVISTINESSVLYALARTGRALGIPLAFDRLYSHHHLQHFTRASLRQLLRSSGLRLTRHFVHNSPIQAVDIPVRSRSADAALRLAVLAVSVTGSLLSKSYLQTAICSA
jgi:2-polyprenyl-3-methyl-5-hydroxy-6-metoxy-1,4-benzoquinol methylase